MYDRGLSVLEQYELTAKSTYRGRGALICDTQKGLVVIREFQGSEKKLEKQGELLDIVEQSGSIHVDTLFQNQEMKYVSYDKDNIGYYLKRWYEGRECDTKSKEDVIRSVKTLARLHKVLVMPVEENSCPESLVEEYSRHNKELRKIQRFIRKKQQKNSFEMCYLKHVEWFLEKGGSVLESLTTSRYEELLANELKGGKICHGEYNQHNVRLMDFGMSVTNFEKFNCDVQIADLYQFIRKIMEKHDWDYQLGRSMIETYDKEKTLTQCESENLLMRFAYPEKFWKLANYYYTNKKAWISQKNLEKLEALAQQRGKWQEFLQNIS